MIVGAALRGRPIRSNNVLFVSLGRPRSAAPTNMRQALIQRVVEELRPSLPGRFLGKIFQLTPLSFAFDFGLRGDFLYVSVEPASPRLYLIHRRLRDLEKQSVPHGPFAQLLRSTLSGASLAQISKDPLDRIVRFTFHNDEVFRRLAKECFQGSSLVNVGTLEYANSRANFCKKGKQFFDWIGN